MSSENNEQKILKAYSNVMWCHCRGGKIMHLGYHPGLAVAESRKQKSTVTPPEKASSANNSAAMATVTTPSAPAPAPASSATMISEK